MMNEEQRLKPAAATQSSVGTFFSGLAATPRGAVNTAVALFVPTTVTRRPASVTPTASAAGSDPIRHLADANLGSTFNFVYRGVWRVVATLVIPASSVVNMNLSVDAVAADLVVATTPTVGDGSRIIGSVRTTLPAATEISLVAEAEVVVNQQDIGTVAPRKTIRMLISNGAGAVVDPADVTVALANINFTYLRDQA